MQPPVYRSEGPGGRRREGRRQKAEGRRQKAEGRSSGAWCPSDAVGENLDRERPHRAIPLTANCLLRTAYFSAAGARRNMITACIRCGAAASFAAALSAGGLLA